MELLHHIEEYFTLFVNFGMLLLEFIGACILLYTAGKSFLMWLGKKDIVQLELAKGIALALEFKLGGEVLRTVVVREKSELIILGAIVLIRVILTLVIHWEIKQEEHK